MSVDPDWLVPEWHAPGVGALMTTRHGGCSSEPYDTMNLGAGGDDVPQAVAANRRRLAEARGVHPVYLKQVHGIEVARIGASDTLSGAPSRSADASVTAEAGVACTILVADCLPVLFAAPSAAAVGAAHAGWRGLAGGVLEATVTAVCELAGCTPRDLQAWLGPSIGPSRFQVGADVLEAFGALPGGDRHFVPERPGKWLADLPRLARARLEAAGVAAVSGGRWCTFDAPSRFFSYRRDRITGRMAAMVWIEPRV